MIALAKFLIYDIERSQKATVEQDNSFQCLHGARAQGDGGTEEESV